MATLEELRNQREQIAKLMEKKAGQARKLRARIAKAKKALAKLEKQLAAIEGSGIGVAASKRPVRRKGKAKRKRGRRGPGQKEIVLQVLREARKPLSMSGIVAAMNAKGYKWKSKRPERSLSVLLYTNKGLFKTVKPGHFVPAK